MKSVRLTDHAKVRLTERVGVKPEKMEKIALKALKSTDQPNFKANIAEYNSLHKYQTKPNEKRIIKTLMGKAYLFLEMKKYYLLITVV